MWLQGNPIGSWFCRERHIKLLLVRHCNLCSRSLSAYAYLNELTLIRLNTLSISYDFVLNTLNYMNYIFFVQSMVHGNEQVQHVVAWEPVRKLVVQ